MATKNTRSHKKFQKFEPRKNAKERKKFQPLELPTDTNGHEFQESWGFAFFFIFDVLPDLVLMIFSASAG